MKEEGERMTGMFRYGSILGMTFVVVSEFLAVPLAGVCTAFQAAGDEWKAPARQAKRQNPVPADEKSIAAGKTIYQKECLSCHGSSGKGDGPAAKDLPRKCGDLSDAKLWAQTDGALFWKITEGKTPMPAYDKLLKEENDRWIVIHYIRTLAPKPKEEEKK
jgi:mono/diheme cytochrome c family protein